MRGTSGGLNKIEKKEVVEQSRVLLWKRTVNKVRPFARLDVVPKTVPLVVYIAQIDSRLAPRT